MRTRARGPVGRCNFSRGDGEPLSALEIKQSVVIRLERCSQFRLEGGGGGGASPGDQLSPWLRQGLVTP